MKKQNTLTVIDGDTLMDKRLPPTKFCVETLLPQGLCILGGSPKVGKSWFVLDLCVHIARGERLWELYVRKGEALYLCLEDSERRIQERLNTITDDVPPGLYFATGNTSIEGGVCDWIRKFKKEHPALTFAAIDTFQLIRTATADVSYGNDYAELQPLRELAEELQICLLLVHHLRKMGDKDPINKLSGSTGIAGAVDAIYVLEKNERIESNATLYASGRDIQDRKMKLQMESNTCTWQLISDSMTEPEILMPDEMTALIHYMERENEFEGSKLIACCRKEKALTQADLAEKLGITDRAVSKWETGKSLPDANIMLELCDLLGISVTELLVGERITMEDYKKVTEAELLEMAEREKRNGRKLLFTGLAITVACCLTATVMLCAAALAVADTLWRWILNMSFFFDTVAVTV